MEPLDISLCMIVRDEESLLRRCLSSVIGIVSEIVIVDTGSVDGTINIAKQFGAHVVQFSWCDDFAAARNAGLELATRKWILVLDADEELLTTKSQEWMALLGREDIFGYYVKLISYVGELPEQDYVTDWVCRLFRNHAHIRFAGKIHEEVATSIQALPNAMLEFSSVMIRHDGYLDAILSKKEKKQRNMAIIRQAILQNPEDPVLQYALGSEHFQAGDYTAAVEVLKPLLLQVPVYSGYTSDVLLKTAYALREIGRQEEALRLVQDGLKLYPDFQDLLELEAILQMDHDQYAASIETLSLALQAGQSAQSIYSSSSGSGAYRTRYLAGVACERLYMWEQAHRHYQASLEQRADDMPVWQRWPIIALLLGEANQLAHMVHSQSHLIPQPAWTIVFNTLLTAQLGSLAVQIADQCSLEPALYPYLQPVMLAQTGLDDEASRLLEQIKIDRDHQLSISLYLWAIAIKDSRLREAMTHLERCAESEPEYQSIISCLRGQSTALRNESAYRKCQQVLIQVGAWDGFVRFQRMMPERLPWPWLPAHALYGLLYAPHTNKVELLEQCQMRIASLSYSERLFAGMLAIECGRRTTAVEIFKQLHKEAPNRSAPRVGLMHAYAASARSAGEGLCRVEGLTNDLRWLTVSHD
jgi:tetratricopeptide (TPR) repeat protein